MTPEQQEKARNVKRLANKFFEAADAGDEQLYDEYAVELELAVTEVVNDIEERMHAEDRQQRPYSQDGAYMTREEDQLQRESDERAAFNDHLDNLRNER